ncbi:MAG: hypothetical protein JKY53_08665 [Flavobacteriales bacterium]|nr:hypothetical protein [Flavobacteriales bacterium]
MKKIIGLISIALVLTNCKKPFEELEYSDGGLDFSNYIAVGNSLTQGYQDGGLYEATQVNSYPAIIARQMKLVQPDMPDFIQPLAPGNGSGYIHLEYINDVLTVVKPREEGGYAEDATWDNLIQNVAYSNLGVSGIKLINVVSDPNIPSDDLVNYLVLRNNPFGHRFLDFGFSNSPTEYLQHVANSNPTFFTSWLGNNDILSFATNGGVESEFEIGGTNFYLDGLSDPAEFRKKYDQSLDSLTKNGAKGIVATLPSVTSIPYFNVVKQADIVGTDGVQLTLYKADEDGNVYEVQPDDILLLPVASTLLKFERDSITADGDVARDPDGNAIVVYTSIPHGVDRNNPLKDSEVLDPAEYTRLQATITSLNIELKASAASHNIPVVDMYTHLIGFEAGVQFNGIEFSTKYIEGGVFSLDGVHPNSKGYAIIANKFIDAINENYGASIPKANINNYPGIVFP